MSYSQDQSSGPVPNSPTQIQQLRAGAEELLVRIQANLNLLDDGAEPTRRILRDLRLLIDEVRQALKS
jgi:hypothetical protein